MRVAQITSATRLKYGAMAAMLLLEDGLVKNGIEVQFLTFTGRGGGDELRALGKPVHEVKVRFKIDLLASIRIAKWIKQQKIDVVHTHLSTSSLNGCLAAKIAKVPGVATVHGLSGKASFMFAIRIIAVSNAVKTHLVQQGVAESKITVVYNGVSMAPCEPQERVGAKEAIGLDSNQLVLATLGRVNPLKGVYEAIQALGLIKDKLGPFTLLVLGEGEDLNRCRLAAKEVGLADQVKFVGFVEDVRKYLLATDLLVFPTFKEAMPLALLEAARCQVPVVGFDVGGVPEVVSVGTGLIVPVGDVDALSDAILKLGTDEKLRLGMGIKSQSLSVNRFSVEAMVSNTIAVYSRELEQFSRK